jgi:hypothetical protein
LLIRLGFVLRPLLRTHLLLLTLTPACSCDYFCKFQFRPIHPPSRRLSFPCTPTLPRCAVGPPCQFRLPYEPPWTSAHARQDPRPHRLPMQPSSLLSTAHTRTRSPASFHASSPSLALCSRRSTLPELHGRTADRPVRQKPCQGTPSSVPR